MHSYSSAYINRAGLAGLMWAGSQEEFALEEMRTYDAAQPARRKKHARARLPRVQLFIYISATRNTFVRFLSPEFIVNNSSTVKFHVNSVKLV